MLRIILLAIICCSWLNLFSQHFDNPVDTSSHYVTLQNSIRDSKIIAVPMGSMAVLYTSANAVKDSLIKLLSLQSLMDDDKKEIQASLLYLNKISSRHDTIYVDVLKSHLQYAIGEQLKMGNARIFYKKEHSFVPYISWHLYRYITMAYRCYCLPDSQEFYRILVLTGIEDDFYKINWLRTKSDSIKK